jgi:predicted nucleic acid-binding protein
MHKTVISDTSCLILLSKIDKLGLLQELYGEVFTTLEIATEYGLPLPEWIRVKIVADKQKQQLLELQLDIGEASALALALEIQDCTVILDDLKARKLAVRMHIRHTGTLGIIISAKKKGVIASIRPILDAMDKTDFRISDELRKLALQQAGEL